MSSTVPAEPHSELKILVVEDNPTNQKLLMQILDRLGYTCACAKDGLEALEAFRRCPYDVVFMDVQMPRMDGLTATRQIRQEFPAEQQPQIIGVTGYAFSEDHAECTVAGMDLCLIKPIRLATLTQTLNRCLLRKRLSLAHSSQPSHLPLDILDPERVAEIWEVAGDKAAEFLISSATEYFETVPVLLRAFREAIAQNQPAIMHSSARMLKSISAFLGATQLVALCQTLEHQDREHQDQPEIYPGTVELVKKVEQEYERVKRALEIECEKALKQK
jgi:CheY-like chemotaxis protein